MFACVVLNRARNSGAFSILPCHEYIDSTRDMLTQAASLSRTSLSAILVMDSLSGYVESMMAGFIQNDK